MASSNPSTVQLVSAALGAGAQVGVLLPRSRQQESEADHLGLILMAKAGYDPHASLELCKNHEGLHGYFRFCQVRPRHL